MVKILDQMALIIENTALQNSLGKHFHKKS